tara:strand:- start:1239 stop:2051 length:813 start_codon:yes stop_codon:yes gene_type:complete
MAEIAKQTPAWKSSVDNGYHQMIKIFGGEEKAEAKEKAMIEYRYALTQFQTNPSLQKCDANSILTAVINVAQTSLTLNPAFGLAYLIPRRGRCCLDISYKGMIKLLRDSNSIRDIEAHMVFDDEQFDIDIPTNKLSHKKVHAKSEAEHMSRKIHGCYSRAILPTGDVSFEFMPLWELDKVRSKSASKEGAVWKEWRDEMYKKTVIKRHSKRLISSTSPELMAALSVDNDNHGLKTLRNKSKLLQVLESEAVIVEDIAPPQKHDSNQLAIE